MDDGAGGIVEQKVKFPIWFDPVASGGTPMHQAMTIARTILSNWVVHHPTSFPPIVINITDGESQDGDIQPYAEPIRSLATEDGNVLLFNCHLSETAADPFMFPSSDEILPDELARFLFRASSVLPEPIYQQAVSEGASLQPNARGMAFNMDMVCLIRFLDMGTRPAKQLR